MREAIGQSYVINFIIVFFALFIFIFLATLSYTKAFKVKNKIVDIIESENGNVVDTNGQLKDSVAKSINGKLKQIGYHISTNQNMDCENDRFSEDTKVIIPGNSGYRYCIYEISTSSGKDKGDGRYYGVVAYIYFEVPIIGAKMEFPVYGETKIYYK